MSLWSCTTCSKSFSRKGDLTRHKSLHTGIKPHVCEICGKGFAQFSGLKTHRNVHSKAKPYTCGIGTCTKAFGDPSSRTRHRKETHKREGAYKCIITDCETRIKRRSAFAAHLRKHGLDTESFNLDAIVLQNSERDVPALAHLTCPAVENKSHHKVESRSASPSLLQVGDNSGYYILGDSGEATYLMNNTGWLDDDPLDCRRQANRFLANDALFLGSISDQIVNVHPSDLPHDIYAYLPRDFEEPFCFDGIFRTTAGYPVLGPFLEAENDGLHSSSSSPLSTYSALYTTNFNGGDMISLPVSNNAPHESLLYNTM